MPTSLRCSTSSRVRTWRRPPRQLRQRQRSNNLLHACCYSGPTCSAPDSGKRSNFFGTLARIQWRNDDHQQRNGMMNHPRLRKLVTAVNELTLAERITLVKGLVPAIADELSDTEYEKFVDSIRLKGERFHEAQAHPGEGRKERKVPGERDVEGR